MHLPKIRLRKAFDTNRLLQFAKICRTYLRCGGYTNERAHACARGIMQLTTFTITKTDTFDVGQTLDCGQVFRYVKTENGYRLYALNHVAYIEEREDEYVVECDDKEFSSNTSISTPIMRIFKVRFKTAVSCRTQSNSAKVYTFCAKIPSKAFFVHNFAKQSYTSY